VFHTSEARETFLAWQARQQVLVDELAQIEREATAQLQRSISDLRGNQ
jgi:hypothetical protein